MQNDAAASEILRAMYPNVEDTDPSSYFGQIGSVYDALCYSWLFWPKLMEIHGAVFIGVYDWNEEWIYERITTPANPNGEDWPEMSWKEAVDSFNRVETGSLFQWWPESFEYAESTLEILSEALVQMWRARLQYAYPQREFSVTFMDSDHFLEIGVEVVQECPALEVPVGWDPVRRFIDRV